MSESCRRRGALCQSNERPSSNEVFSRLPARNSGSGNYQAEHCHCASSSSVAYDGSS